MSAAPINLKRFGALLAHRGAEILGPTNEWELLRFRSSECVGVIYTSKAGGYTWNAAAKKARAKVESGKTICPVPKIKKPPAALDAIADAVLRYRPKPVSDAAKERKRRAKRVKRAKKVEAGGQ